MADRKLIFIAGSGRSSSTLFAVLLSQCRDCFNLGQIRDLDKAYEREAPCSCGVPVKRCAFWAPVCESVFGAEPQAALQAHAQAFRALCADTADLRVWQDSARRAEVLW